mmetsp:Transcript_107975/g.311999  ORF Transcript_107975/g.311999 Transcript_107975/m.311999 type:complete len:266 (-) Transcript_107975:397-1194(-)
MDDVLLPKEPQSRKQLDGEAPDQTQGDALEIVVLDELVQVDAQQLECDAQMVPEVEVVHHVHDVRCALDVPLPNVLEDLDFHEGLVMEPLLVPNHLQGYIALGLVVEGAHDLTERSFTEGVHDLIPIQNVIMKNDQVVPSLVVVRVVVRGCGCPPNLRRPGAVIPHLREVQDLALLILRELVDVVLQHLRRRHGELGLLRLVLLRRAAIGTEAQGQPVALGAAWVALLYGPLLRALRRRPRRHRATILWRRLAGATRGAQLPCCL